MDSMLAYGRCGSHCGCWPTVSLQHAGLAGWPMASAMGKLMLAQDGHQTDNWTDKVES